MTSDAAGDDVGGGPGTPHWLTLLRDGWGAAVDGAAMCVDAAQHCCYVHGGHVAGQRGTVSDALYCIALTPLAHTAATTTTRRHANDAAAVTAHASTYTTSTNDDGGDDDDSGGAAADATRARNDDDDTARVYAALRRSVTCTRLRPLLPHTPAAASLTSAKRETSATIDYTTTTALDTPGTLPPPALRDHVLFRHGPYLVVHGGRDAHGIVQSRLHTFHVDARRWEELHGLLGGCAAPRLCDHAVAPLDADSGTYILMGDENSSSSSSISSSSTTSNSAQARHGDRTYGYKRPRTDNLDSDDDDEDKQDAYGSMAGWHERGTRGADAASVPHTRPPQQQTPPPSSLSVFVLHMNAFQRGWQRLCGSGNSAMGSAPCARGHFALTVCRDADAVCHNNDDDNDGGYADRYVTDKAHSRSSWRPCVYDGVDASVMAYVVGGVTGKQACFDAWRLCVATGVWRRVALTPHPARRGAVGMMTTTTTTTRSAYTRRGNNNNNSSRATTTTTTTGERDDAEAAQASMPLLLHLLDTSSDSATHSAVQPAMASVVSVACATPVQRRRVQPYSNFDVHYAGLLLLHDASHGSNVLSAARTSHNDDNDNDDNNDNSDDDDGRGDAAAHDGNRDGVRVLLMPRAGAQLRQSRLHNADSYCYRLAPCNVRVPGRLSLHTRPHLALQQCVRLPTVSSVSCLGFFVVRVATATTMTTTNTQAQCNERDDDDDKDDSIRPAAHAAAHVQTWLCCVRRTGELKAVRLP